MQMQALRLPIHRVDRLVAHGNVVVFLTEKKQICYHRKMSQFLNSGRKMPVKLTLSFFFVGVTVRQNMLEVSSRQYSSVLFVLQDISSVPGSISAASENLRH